MIQQVLSHYHLPLLSCAGLLIFVGVFTGSLIWVFRKGSTRFYTELANLAVESEPKREAIQ